MTPTQRFWAGTGCILCSVLIYAWHHRAGTGPSLFDLLWHVGLLLLALALLVPRFYRATLDFLGAVLRPRDRDVP